MQLKFGSVVKSYLSSAFSALTSVALFPGLLIGRPTILLASLIKEEVDVGTFSCESVPTLISSIESGPAVPGASERIFTVKPRILTSHYFVSVQCHHDLHRVKTL